MRTISIRIIRGIKFRIRDRDGKKIARWIDAHDTTSAMSGKPNTTCGHWRFL